MLRKGAASRAGAQDLRQTYPYRFTRRLSLIPGLRVNLSRRGASMSIGAWYTIGPAVGGRSWALPGTGLFWTET
jgi:Protein of unknown function (DUF4236)